MLDGESVLARAFKTFSHHLPPLRNHQIRGDKSRDERDKRRDDSRGSSTRKPGRRNDDDHPRELSRWRQDHDDDKEDRGHGFNRGRDKVRSSGHDVAHQRMRSPWRCDAGSASGYGGWWHSEEDGERNVVTTPASPAGERYVVPAPIAPMPPPELTKLRLLLHLKSAALRHAKANAYGVAPLPLEGCGPLP
ncbi:hypothetical protein E2562_007325 [Oryza meyeriana var. granulata]|uniref:Uncharacterized protein n=1 Tax=Oryza meyeriana var. granulata TaxID=110450 RepID=A0A6G1CYL0_9ORYZ|nr:hypothetical protein E2562_007325 [Oryza meyeriana var. granulata]